MLSRPLPTRRRAVLLCLLVTLTVLASISLVSAAALVPAPAAVVPFVALVGACGPMLAGLELPGAIRALRDAGWAASLRRHLEQLPETEHPLGL